MTVYNLGSSGIGQRNPLAEWKTLQAGRSFTINVRGKPLRIEDGADVEAVVAAIEKKLKE